MQVYIYARKQVCKYASIQVCKYESMQVYTDLAELCKGMTRYSMIQPYIARLCKSIVRYRQLMQSNIKIQPNQGKLIKAKLSPDIYKSYRKPDMTKTCKVRYTYMPKLSFVRAIFVYVHLWASYTKSWQLMAKERCQAKFLEGHLNELGLLIGPHKAA